MSAIGVSGIEIDPSTAENLGAGVPPADACSFAAGDRLMALALFMCGGRKSRAKASASSSSPSPSAVVLALASGGDAATVEAPAPDPRGQGARRLLLAVARSARASSSSSPSSAAASSSASSSSSSSSSSVLSPPRGVRPPRLSFECGTLLAGGDAAAYLNGLGVFLPPGAAAASEELIVNVGTFEAVGVFESKAPSRSRGDGGENGKEAASTPVAIAFSEPARMSPSDPAYDPDFDS